MALTIEDIIGRRVEVVKADHPWCGAVAEVTGFTENIGLKVKVVDDPEFDGQEFYLTSTNDYEVIPV